MIFNIVRTKQFTITWLPFVLVLTSLRVIGGPLIKLAEDTTSHPVFPMGFFELNFGTTYRSAGMAGESQPSVIQTNYATGFSGRMQSSVLWNYRHTQQTKHRFTWGDIIAAEIFTGTLSTKLQHESGNLWVAYQFDFGLGGRLTINDHSEAGLNLILLKFSRDNVSGNISGSGIVGRYRYKRLLAEGGLIARHDRALGVIIDLRDRIAMQGTWTLRYLMKRGKNIGVTAESLPGIFHQDTFQYTRIWSVKIFYGIYF